MRVIVGPPNKIVYATIDSREVALVINESFLGRGLRVGSNLLEKVFEGLRLGEAREVVARHQGVDLVLRLAHRPDQLVEVGARVGVELLDLLL